MIAWLSELVQKIVCQDWEGIRVQELCKSRDGRPGLPVLMSLMVFVDVKHH